MDDEIFWGALALLVVGIITLGPVVAMVLAGRATSKLRTVQLELEDTQAGLRTVQRDLLVLKLAVEPLSARTPTPTPEVPVLAAPEPVVEAAPEPVVESAPEPVVESAPEPVVEVAPEPLVARPTTTSIPGIERMGAWAFAAAGGLGLLVGGLLFFAYGLDAGWFAWFGPGARFLTGVLAGIGALVGSELLIRRGYTAGSAGAGGAGVGLLYGALYAGFDLYELLPQGPTFALMCGVTAVSVLLAWKRGSRLLAVLGLLGGLLTPILVSSGDNKALILFGYLALLNAGMLAVAVRRKWPELPALATLGTLIVEVGWALEYGAPDQLPVGLGAALVFAGLYAFAALHERTGERMRRLLLAASLVPWLAVLPLLVPRDLVSYTSGGPRFEDPGPLVWLVPVFLVAMSLLHARLSRRESWLGLASLATLGLSQLVLVLGWEPSLERVGDPLHWGHGLVAMGLVAPLLARWPGGGLSERGRSLELEISASLLATGALAALGVVAGGSSMLLACVVGTTVGVVGALASYQGRGWTAIAGLAASLLPLYGALPRWSDEAFLSVASPAVLAVVAVVTVWPFLAHRDEGGRSRLGPWLASALAGPVFYPFLHLAWEEAWGGEILGLLPVVLGAVSLTAALVLRQRLLAEPGDRKLALYVVAGTLFACVAVPVQLEGQWITLGWALQAMVLAALGRRFVHPGLRLFAVALIGLVAGRLLLEPTVIDFPAQIHPIFNELVVTYLIVGGSWFVAAGQLDKQPPVLEQLPIPSLIRAAVVLLAFALLNLELALLFAEDGMPRFAGGSLGQEMARSISWGLFGAGLLGLGVQVRRRWLRLFAMAFLVLAAGKVFFVDLWDLEGMWRVGSVLGAALSLLGSALLLQKVVLGLEPRDAEAAA
jgi:uncharacterized membrane protein